jgi:hypothetical protein
MDPVGMPLSSFIPPELYFALLTHLTLTAAPGIAPGNPRNQLAVGLEDKADGEPELFQLFRLPEKLPALLPGGILLELVFDTAVWPGSSLLTPSALTTAHGRLLRRTLIPQGGDLGGNARIPGRADAATPANCVAWCRQHSLAMLAGRWTRGRPMAYGGRHRVLERTGAYTPAHGT